MANYCSNSVAFTGDNKEKAMAHFESLGYDAPPFLVILIYDGKVNFESRWIPPIRDLNQIAEQFDVSYRLQYHVPGEDRATFQYTCLQQQALSPQGNMIRDTINRAATRQELNAAEILVNDQLLSRSLNQHELGVLALLLGKRFTAFGRVAPSAPDVASHNNLPWESNDPDTERTRSR